MPLLDTKFYPREKLEPSLTLLSGKVALSRTVGSLGNTMAPQLPSAQSITLQWTMPTEASLCSYHSLHILDSMQHKN